MNIFDFAIQKETEAEATYRDMAAKTPDAGLKKILLMLADDEKKHARVIERMKVEADVSLFETQILTNAKNTFVRMRENGENITTGSGQVELYRKAQEMERQSEDYYRQKEKEVSEPAQRTLFSKLADEEKKHFMLLHHIIEMISRPEHWLEDAEFVHLDEY